MSLRVAECNDRHFSWRKQEHRAPWYMSRYCRQVRHVPAKWSIRFEVRLNLYFLVYYNFAGFRSLIIIYDSCNIFPIWARLFSMYLLVRLNAISLHNKIYFLNTFWCILWILGCWSRKSYSWWLLAGQAIQNQIADKDSMHYVEGQI